MPFVLLFLLTLLLTLVLTVTATRLILPVLKRYHLGQRILEIGPAWHRTKAGTPTMGGLAFVAASLLGLLVAGGLLARDLPALFWRPLLLSFLYALSNAIIGAIDDGAKLRKKENEGLTPPQKLLLQIATACAYIALLRYYGHIDTTLYIPFLDTVWELGFLYDVIAVLLAVGMVNFVNLSDGVDGLASSLVCVLSAFFIVAATLLHESTGVLMATAAMGACLGFLVFNRHPARIFMGDTGSLFLGGMCVGCGFLIENPLILLVAGGAFVLEGISVILQVAWYKISGKRLFLMAPFHHHLEKRGLSENAIVLRFVLLGIALGALALLGIG